VSLLDTVVTILSFIVANYLRSGALKIHRFGGEIAWTDYWIILVFIIIIWRGLLEYYEAYSRKSFRSLKNDILMVTKTVLIGTAVVLTIAFMIKSNVPRTLVFFFSVVNLLLLSLEKMFVYRVVGYLQRKGKNIKTVLLMGWDNETKIFVDRVEKYSEWGIKIIGLICKEKSDVGKKLFGYKVVGHLGDLHELIHLNPIDELIIALSGKHIIEMEQALRICDEEGVAVQIVSPFFKDLASKAKHDMIHGIPVIRFTSVEHREFEDLLKRSVDIVISFVLIILLLPVLALTTILIKIDSPGPVFFRWKIIGLNRRKLISYKFRTMVEDAEEIEQQMRESNLNEMEKVYFKIEKDPRVGRLGGVLRKFSIDELPSLFSVLKGDMSIVGPRAVRWNEYELLTPWHNRIFSTKPGLTSPWIVKGKNKITDFNEIAQMNIEYIQNRSFLYDIKIIFQTILMVLLGRNY